MRRVLLALAVSAIALPLAAERIVDENGRVIQVFRPNDHPSVQAAPQARASNLVYHNGPVIPAAHVVEIFWGPSWGTNGNPGGLASELMGFFANFGTTGEYNVITQYSGIQKTNLSNDYWIDGVNPSNVAVTDAMIQAEVVNYFNASGHSPDASTIYEVFLPVGYYAQIGTATSCGGPHLQFCAYHSNFSYGGVDVKYASMPQPSCGGCQTSGWTTGQNFEHFATHETREAVTDPDGNAWYDRQGNEADDKCAWSPTPFLDAGYGYQYEWSNADSKCVKMK